MSKLRSEAAQGLAELAARMAEGQRLARGRRYQTRGQVGDLDVGPGWATASVVGSRSDPYEVAIACRHANENERQAAEIDVAGAVPRAVDVAFTCICPDWGDPCKHGVAVLLELAAQVDADESLLLAWRSIDDVVPPPPPGTESLVGPHTDTTPVESLRLELGDMLASPEDLAGAGSPAQSPVLAEFFEGAMEPGIGSIVRPFDEVQLDAYAAATIVIDNVDAGPVFADGLDAIAEYWLTL